MSKRIHTISTWVDIPVCTSTEDIRASISDDTELQKLQAHLRKGRPQNKDEIEPSLGGYWSIMHDLVIISGVAMKGK